VSTVVLPSYLPWEKRADWHSQMPLMSGVEVASHVREMGQHIYIVGCTGNALREDQEEYMSAGADDILTKPIHQKAVLVMIGEARKRIAGETIWVRGAAEEARRGSG
jgi:DNA-binding response OmpR family regulator